MDPSDVIKLKNSSKIIGGVLIALSLYLFFYTDHINTALALTLIGFMTIVLLHDDFVDLKTSKAQLTSSFHPLDTLLTSLAVEKNGIYVPRGEDLNVTRVFIPADKAGITEKEDLPTLDDHSTLFEGKGVALEPPGLPLFQEAKAQIIEKEKLEEPGELCMSQLTHSMNLARTYNFTEDDKGHRLRITHGPYNDYCEERRERSDFVCERTACPICSSYLISAVEELGTPLRIAGFKKEGRHALFRLEEI